eukprot:226071_1
MYLSMTAAFAVIFTICVHTQPQCEVETETLCINEITGADGFGVIQNRYAFAMQVFKGDVYVSTLNAVNAPEGIVAFFFGEEFLTFGSQIYRANPNEVDEKTNAWNWTPVVINGLHDALNYGVRKFAVVNNYMYGVTGNHENGFEVWQTFDGLQWNIVMNGGNGDLENTSGRGMGAHGGYLYIGAENRVTGAKMYRILLTNDGGIPDGAFWQEVISDGLGDINNFWFSDFMEYRGYLYTGTLNQNGMQIWRTINGLDYQRIPQTFPEQIFAAMKLYVFNDRLYIGTMNLAALLYPAIGGAGLWVSDDQGLQFINLFTGGGPPGYENIWNAYMWYLQGFQQRLYVGTFNMDGFLNDGPATGFNLFSSQNPDEPNAQWILESVDGFGNPGNYGLRSMSVVGNKLIMGTATANETLACKVFEATAIVQKDNKRNINLSVNNNKTTYNKQRYNRTSDNLKRIVCKDKMFAKFHMFKQFCAMH